MKKRRDSVIIFKNSKLNLGVKRMSVIDSRRYGRPCMTNLPPDLGRAIFKHILNTPPVDDEKMKAESARLVAEMLKIRKEEMAVETANANA